MALLAYNRKKQFFAPDVEDLIKALTGFEEGDKNFQEVARYIYSNIIHHNFATVDITSVNRSVQGIVEKFKIHGLERRAKRFQELVDKYLSSDSSHHTQLNVQWHVLLLLLRLAYKPISVPEKELLVSKNEAEDDDVEKIINWPEYLKEGLEEYQLPDTDEDEELWLSAPEDEDDSYKPPPQSLPVGISRYETCGYGEVPHPSQWRLHSPPPSRTESLRRLLREAALSEQWLRDNVYQSTCSNSHSLMCKLWEQVTLSKHDRDASTLPKITVMSERKIIQEVLWMLQVSTDTSLFFLDEQDMFRVQSNLSLPTTMPDTLRLVLEGLCPYFDMINKLRQFEEDLNKHEMSDNPPPATYNAYCAALFQQLEQLNNLVVHLEDKLQKQEETMTLLSVLEELSNELGILEYLYNVHTKAVTHWNSHESWLCATRLLSVLYESMVEANDQSRLEACLSLFIHSFHVYLDIIDVWLSEGRLEDWRCEFLVIRRGLGGSLQVMPYEEEMRSCGVEPVSFLTKLVSVVRQAGYTLEITSQLNKLPQLCEMVNNKGCLFKEFTDNVYNEIKRIKSCTEPNLLSESTSTYDYIDDNFHFDINVVNLQNEIEDKEKNEDHINSSPSNLELINTLPGETQTSCTNYKTLISGGKEESNLCSPPKHLETVSLQQLYHQTLQSLMDHPLLSQSLKQYFSETEAESDSQTPTVACRDMVRAGPNANSAGLVCLMSLHNVLEQQLELVITRYKIASCIVVETLRKEYSLLQHFTVLRTVFFMEAGNLAQRFYSHFFKEVESGSWNNPVSLSVHLQLCVEEFYPGFSNFFTVHITKPESTNLVHRAIPSISLAYRVDWPISLVVTQDAIDSYNKVFRFLLHIKYASWTLHNMRFSELASCKNTEQVRRLQILRHWMHSSTYNLDFYFMELVQRSFSKHLDQSICLAHSIDLIILAHNTFLDEVKVHCLQDKETHVETFIMKLVCLCLSLSHAWRDEAAGQLTSQALKHLEETYFMYFHGLVNCLEVVTEEASANNLLYELLQDIIENISA